jgi:phosphatidylglycerol phospholipase C
LTFVKQIPTFRETIALLMRPENMKVFLNIDVKVDNDPERLFTLMHEIVSSYPEYKTVLAPRLGSSSPKPSLFLPVPS